MTYSEARTVISATHIYLNPTALEAVNCPFNKTLTELNGQVLLGTQEEYTAIESKELKPTE